jgi:hypothetical protein
MRLDERQPNLLTGDAAPFASRGRSTSGAGAGLSSGLSCHRSPPSAERQGRQPAAPRTFGDDLKHKVADLESVLGLRPRGFESRILRRVMSQDMPDCDVARHRRHLEPSGRGLAGWFCAASLVVDGWVKDQLCDGLAGGGVGDANLEPFDQQQDAGSGPTPMWCSQPLWRRVRVSPLSMMSRRTRACGWDSPRWCA